MTVLAYSKVSVLVLDFPYSERINIPFCLELIESHNIHDFNLQNAQPLLEGCRDGTHTPLHTFRPAIGITVYPFMVSLDMNSFLKHFSRCGCSIKITPNYSDLFF